MNQISRDEIRSFMEKYHVDYSIADVTPTICALFGLNPPEVCGAQEIAEVVDAFFREMKIDYEVAPSSDPAFLEGRRADILVGGKVVGVYGEFSPAVIRAFELGYAVVGFEVDLTLLF